MLVGCSSSKKTVVVCPSLDGEGGVATIVASGRDVTLSRPPKVYAVAHGAKTEIQEGESEWCGAIADVFNVVTSDEPLTVRPGEEIVIRNPLPGERIHDAGISFVDTNSAEATPSAGRLTWSFGPSHRRDDLRIDENGVRLAAKDAPGRYVLNVWLSFDPQKDMFEMPRRAAYYALLVDVTE
jgi:hypothetical protein